MGVYGLYYVGIVFCNNVYISSLSLTTQNQAHEISWDAVSAQFVCQDILLVQ